MEIKPIGNVFLDDDRKKWIPVNISFDALSQINKIVLGDTVDKDDSKAVAKRNQIHEDCLKLMNLFTKQ